MSDGIDQLVHLKIVFLKNNKFPFDFKNVLKVSRNFLLPDAAGNSRSLTKIYVHRLAKGCLVNFFGLGELPVFIGKNEPLRLLTDTLHKGFSFYVIGVGNWAYLRSAQALLY